MPLRTFLLLALLLVFGSVVTLPAADIAPGEKAKIEALVSYIEGLSDAKFIRNGSEYDAKTAAKFLRGKWQSNQGSIKTAADFIEIAATRSSTTGQAYMIRLKDAAPVPCAEVLKARLHQLAP